MGLTALLKFKPPSAHLDDVDDVIGQPEYGEGADDHHDEAAALPSALELGAVQAAHHAGVAGVDEGEGQQAGHDGLKQKGMGSARAKASTQTTSSSTSRVLLVLSLWDRKGLLTASQRSMLIRQIRKRGAPSSTVASANAKFSTSRQVTERFFTRQNTDHATNRFPGKPSTNAAVRMAMPTWLLTGMEGGGPEAPAVALDSITKGEKKACVESEPPWNWRELFNGQGGAGNRKRCIGALRGGVTSCTPTPDEPRGLIFYDTGFRPAEPFGVVYLPFFAGLLTTASASFSLSRLFWLFWRLFLVAESRPVPSNRRAMNARPSRRMYDFPAKK
ncbi:hypothetical protein EYF80_050956 [Liparis tanakae]|uniref:Uncharacterized protein n=1 Tax=Liparis tanakae TaxID=230148 RepID=A0A4Z2FD20_9TELE|nr:hypothetical protein EYF80_050956 [Liparis tanakae]